LEVQAGLAQSSRPARSDIIVQRLQEAAGEEFRLVRLQIEDIRRLPGAHGGFGLGVDIRLGDEAQLHRTLRIGRLEGADAGGDPVLLGRFIRPVAPHVDLRGLRRSAAHRSEQSRGDERRATHITPPHWLISSHGFVLRKEASRSGYCQ